MQLEDLERRFGILSEEKRKLELGAHEESDLHYKKNGQLQSNLTQLSTAAISKDIEIREANNNLTAYKRIVDEKNFEIANLNKEIEAIEKDNAMSYSIKKDAEADLTILKSSHRVAQNEAESLVMVNEHLKKEQVSSAEKLRGAALEAARLERQIETAKGELETLRELNLRKDREIRIASEGRFSKIEEEKVESHNSRLLSEKASLSNKRNEIEIQIRLANRKLEEESIAAELKEKELRTLKYEPSIEARMELRELEKKNETLRVLMEHYKDDAEFQKRLRDQATMSKLQLSDEKKKLEKEAIMKEMEARAAKRELERVQGTHERLLDDKYEVSKELTAIKEHAELLENQNQTVSLNC